jgi:hypothetical protein
LPRALGSRPTSAANRSNVQRRRTASSVSALSAGCSARAA